MIPGKNTDRTLTSNIEGEAIIMGIDENSLAHVMSMLIDVYNVPEAAVLREYSVNARDSHIAAGQTRPIEVTLPNALSPLLKIKDYGLGLGRLDIVDVYSKYGASTKRNSNEVTGSLGIGSKSALTYTSQFTVVGVKDQLRTMIAVTRDEDDGGTMTIMEESETTEPNGVEIVIPAKQHNDLASYARDLFQYWPKGSVLVNGEEPKRIKGLNITDNILLAENKEFYEAPGVIVMGGVPYEIPPEVSPFKSQKYKLVAFVEMGDVNFPPSREALTLTKHTKKRLERLSYEIKKALATKIAQDIEAASDPHHAAEVYFDWKTALFETGMSLKTISYQKKTFPLNLEFPKEEQEKAQTDSKGEPLVDKNGDPLIRSYIYQKSFIISNVGSAKVGESHNLKVIPFQQYLNCMQVTGFDVQEFSPPHKRKLEKYCSEHDLKPKSFLLTRVGDGPLETEWIDPAYLIDWADVKDIKLERKARIKQEGPVRPKGLYAVMTSEGRYTRETQAENLPLDKPLYYLGPREFTNGKNPKSYVFEDCTKEACQRLEEEHDCTIVSLGVNRWDKFKRDFPQAKSAKETLSKIHNRLVGSITKKELEAWCLSQHSDASILAKLDESQVEDPQLVDMIKLVLKAAPKKIARIQAFTALHTWLDKADKSFLKANPKQINILRERYPLLLSLKESYYRYQADLYFYLNAAHQAKKGQ